ncbi:MAG: tetratricopeptide repeat protein [Candidatus Omnitrophica bacterium]|nr:tetratricopeptide repeat protein [Candidatus Omnitrophota bacterium]
MLEAAQKAVACSQGRSRRDAMREQSELESMSGLANMVRWAMAVGVFITVSADVFGAPTQSAQTGQPWEDVCLGSRQAVQAAEQARGAQHPDVATALNNVAMNCDALSVDDRIQLMQRALGIWETALGSADSLVGSAANNLAFLYQEKGDLTKAEALHKRALAVYEGAPGRYHQDLLSGLNALAGLYIEQGRYADAESLLKRVLSLEEQEHAVEEVSLSKLGLVYDGQGRYVEADSVYQRAVAVREERRRSRQGKKASSPDRRLYEQSLAIRERALGPNHPEVAALLECYAAIVREDGKVEEADAAEARAKAIRAKAQASQ